MPDNTKPPGMKSSLTAEQLAALEGAPVHPAGIVGAEDQSNKANETTEAGLLNSTEQVFVPFAGEEDLVTGAEGQRKDFLIEVLLAYRSQLVGLIDRQGTASANAYGSSLLNPPPTEVSPTATRVISAAERGIAKVDFLLREYGYQPVAHTPEV